MKKVFISVGMNGRDNRDVALDIGRAVAKIVDRYGRDVELVDNYDCVAPENVGRLWYLGEAIKKLDGCEVCYFVKGWEKHKGCLVEMEVCKIYGIETVEE